MLKALQDIRDEAIELKTTVSNGFDLVEDDFEKLLAKIEHAFGIHTADKPQPAEGVQVITGSADASAETPAGYAPIANAEPAPADPAPAA